MKNPSPELQALVADYLSAGLAPERQQRLEELLRADPAARDDFLRMADLHACLAADESLWAQPAVNDPVGTAGLQRSARWQFGRIAAAAGFIAFGLIVGFLSATWIGAGVVPVAKEPQWSDLGPADGGFERQNQPEPSGLPSVPGVWAGDFARIVGPEQGVSPIGGRMLRFLRSDNTATPPGSVTRAAQLWQIVDLTPWRQQVQAGGTLLQFGAAFARAANASPCKFGVGVHAFSGPVQKAAQAWANHRVVEVGGADKDEPASRPPGEWQRVTTQLALPTDADFLVIEIRAADRSGGESGYVEFAGHYADDVKLLLTRGGNEEKRASRR